MQTLNAIPSEMFYQPAKLTSRTKKRNHMIIDGKYQGHAKALTKAGLDPKISPSIRNM